MATCPMCKTEELAKVNAPEGTTSYVITTVNTNSNPPSFNPTSGLPVNLLGCKKCGIMLLHTGTLK